MTTRPAVERTPIPWALSRLVVAAPLDVDFVAAELDPITQTAVYRDRSGAMVDPIEAGKHGRVTNTYKRTATNRGDGRGPSTSDSDSNVDGRPDPGGCL